MSICQAHKSVHAVRSNARMDGTSSQDKEDDINNAMVKDDETFINIVGKCTSVRQEKGLLWCGREELFEAGG